MDGLATQCGMVRQAGGGGFDADAQDYFDRIVAAGSSISSANQAAVNALIVGLKSDGVWSAMKACCLLAGADDLTGALVPLIGSAPTNNGFIAGDYSRTLGLQGDGSSYLDSNRANNADPQNSKHIATYVTADPAQASSIMGVQTVASGGSWIGRNSDTTTSSMRANSSASYTYANAWPIGSGLIGVSRSGSSSIDFYAALGLKTSTISSATPTSENIWVFRAFASSATPRISFYSIGENLDLNALSARLDDFMSNLS